MKKITLFLIFSYVLICWAGRPVIHQKDLSDITMKAEYIILAEYLGSSEIQDSNKCEILTHNIKVIKVIKPENDQTFDSDKNIGVGINPMWANDCYYRISRGEKGVSFYAESFNEGLDLSLMKKGTQAVYYIFKTRDNKIPWSLVMNGAIVDPNKVFLNNETNVTLKAEDWTVLSFNKIPKSDVQFSNNQISVKVNKSAGPIVYKFKKPIKISEFSIKGKLIGSKKVETTDFDEDSILRFGLVAQGSNKLSTFKKAIAADWVKKLFELAPEKTGIDKIYFYNVTNRKEVIGKNRLHPSSDLIFESIDFFKNENDEYSISKTLDQPIMALGIWLSIDGDNTKSVFENHISEIKVKTDK